MYEVPEITNDGVLSEPMHWYIDTLNSLEFQKHHEVQVLTPMQTNALVPTNLHYALVPQLKLNQKPE